jgi:hypothetical protein
MLQQESFDAGESLLNAALQFSNTGIIFPHRGNECRLVLDQHSEGFFESAVAITF